MSMQIDRVRLQHMREAAQEVITFIDGRQRSDLDTDKMLLRALSMSIGIIGEAANRVTAQTRNKAPDIPWSAIIATRNFLFHEYFRIDANLLWETAIQSIPPLIPQIDALLATIEANKETHENDDN